VGIDADDADHADEEVDPRDSTLVRRAQRGDAAARDALVRSLQP
jgi:hypothetical protein